MLSLIGYPERGQISGYEAPLSAHFLGQVSNSRSVEKDISSGLVGQEAGEEANLIGSLTLGSGINQPRRVAIISRVTLGRFLRITSSSTCLTGIAEPYSIKSLMEESEGSFGVNGP
jgi:hypothetical protein